METFQIRLSVTRDEPVLIDKLHVRHSRIMKDMVNTFRWIVSFGFLFNLLMCLQCLGFPYLWNNTKCLCFNYFAFKMFHRAVTGSSLNFICLFSIRQQRYKIKSSHKILFYLKKNYVKLRTIIWNKLKIVKSVLRI